MALTKIRGNTQIQALTVSNSEIANKDAANPNGILLSKIQDGDLLVKSDGSVAFTATVQGITPVANNDLVTKGYVDGVASGLDVKNSVRVISEANITLSGPQVIDGVSVIAGNRVLVAGQTNGAQNGIYDVAAGAWTRSTDADNSPGDEVSAGMFTFIEEGASSAGSGWVLTTSNPVVLGTTVLEFAQFSAAGTIQAGAGLTKTGNTIDVVSANAGIAVGANNIELKVSADSTLVIGVDGVKLAPLAVGQVLIGSVGSVATAQTLTGDVTMSAAGVTTVASVNGSALTAGSIALDKLVSGSAGQLIVANATGVPTYVTASGDVTVSSTGDVQIVAGAVGIAELATNSVTTQKLVDKSVTLAKLADVPLAQIIIGQGTSVATFALSGDVTMDASGLVTINAATVVRVADIIKREQPTGLVNSANTAFVLANTPKVGTEEVFFNGLLMDAGVGNDYTIAGSTVTFTFVPVAGDKIRVSYFK